MVLNKRIEITALFNYVRKIGVKPIRQETEQAKSQFISTVSHELRTPLTSIKAALGLIQSGVLNHSPEQLQLTVEITCRNTAGLHKLIDQILDLDKPVKVHGGYDIKLVDLTTLPKAFIEVNQRYGFEYGVPLFRH
jgi:signal transduction histidine kinase